MARADSDTPALLDDLVTEARDPAGADLDLRSTIELVELMNAEDATVPDAVRSATREIAAAIDGVAERLRAGGRLVYAGAGTSGRLAVVDAAECLSTFSADDGQVTALVAGGADAHPLAQEASEDDAAAGRVAVTSAGLRDADALVAVSASGRTRYVLGALDAAREAGALTVALTSVLDSPIGRAADHEIAVVVGPEVIAGSTRLKAGTAQKLVLNMISTIAMIRLGKTYGNLMVDVRATNEKLGARVRRIVRLATGEPAARVDEALAAADGEAKVAIVMLLAGVDPETARARLSAADGVVRTALEA